MESIKSHSPFLLHPIYLVGDLATESAKEVKTMDKKKKTFQRFCKLSIIGIKQGEFISVLGAFYQFSTVPIRTLVLDIEIVLNNRHKNFSSFLHFPFFFSFFILNCFPLTKRSSSTYMFKTCHLLCAE